ncbi:MAG: hypothetical protein DI551_04115 [Micavibrio aeruginosavorus]|uniref:Uncharacterized protein n=1 Tax=Micavibrio aeruginosavorus TaxID=349221 RepID=A0A2W5N1J7_9BACT|nr:MAG: hypothetical protein DI551_04115 [Micavibrio aeruginosavorus]
MTSVLRGIFLASISVTVLALGACSTTGGDPNSSDPAASSRVNSILERAAREARASGNKTEALALLDQMYQRNPDDAAVATSYAQALRDDEQLNSARQVVQPFAQGKNPYPDAVVELSMVQLALGQYKEAELTSRRAVELDPKSGRAYLALGTALDAQNYHEQAEVAFRKGIDQWKGDPAPIMNNLALNLASQNKLDQAIDMLQKAQAISPGRMELERNLRIITTLKEGADDFLVNKQRAAFTLAPKPNASTEKTTTTTTVTEKTVTKKTDDAANKQLPPVAKEVTIKKETKPEKVDSAAAKKTNVRGSTQSFNKSND